MRMLAYATATLTLGASALAQNVPTTDLRCQSGPASFILERPDASSSSRLLGPGGEPSRNPALSDLIVGSAGSRIVFADRATRGRDFRVVLGFLSGERGWVTYVGTARLRSSTHPVRCETLVR
jgi:hypothetical protein